MLDEIFFKLQYRKMRSRITREIVTREQAFFHPRPTRIMDKKDLVKQHRVFLGTLKNDNGAPRDMVARAKRARQNGQVVILVTGVFDLLHVTHLEFLQKARALGDVLMIGIESDERVKKIKGEGRPLNSELVRLGRLKKLKITENVFVLPENFGEVAAREKLLKDLRPDILAVSVKTANLKNKKEMAKKHNLELRIIALAKTEISTTAILNKKISVNNLLFAEDVDLLKRLVSSE
jgi:cytidyltransferase-like protein